MPETDDQRNPPGRKPESGSILALFHTVPRQFWFGAGSVLLVSALPLVDLVQFSLSGSLYSHIVLIPVVSIYLVVTRRSASLAREDGRSQIPTPLNGQGQVEDREEKASGFSKTFGAVLVGVGLVGILGYWILGGRIIEADVAVESLLAWQIGAFLLSFWGICLITLPHSAVRSLTFPLGFLVFLVPFPPPVLRGIETVLQHGSAEAAYGLFKMAGTPVFREGLMMQLPGINLEVAPECSGIRSSLVLFITSTLAGYMFLRSNWKRWALALFIVPLAIARNGFRIFVIGELCVRIGPEMIDSPIHHRGGPIFFALSLIPLFLLLWFLWRSEGSVGTAKTKPT